MRLLIPRADRNHRRDLLFTFLIVATSAGLRLWGLKWGLPDQLHSYSYHPDEFLTVGAAFGVIYLQRTWNPGFYNYPSLFLYLSALVIAVALGYGIAGSDASVYLCARVISAVMGIGTVWATLWMGKTLFTKTAGWLAAAILCFIPLHVQHSHFATVDVPSAFFVTLTLGFAGSILRRGSVRDYCLAGAMAGFAAGTKYNAGLAILSPVTAHFLHFGLRKGLARYALLLLVILSGVVAFVLSTPGSLFATGQFVHGILYELRHSAEGHGLVFEGTGNGLVYTLMHSIVPGCGVILVGLFVFSVFLALLTREKSALVVLAFVLSYYILISASQVRFARYAIPLLPGIAVLVSWAVLELWSRMAGEGFIRRGVRIFLLVLCSLALISAMFTSLVLDAAQTGADPRDQAAYWIFANVPKGSRIGVVDWPWFYSPPFEKSVGFGTLPQRKVAAKRCPYKLDVLLSGGSAWHPLPRWVVVSDYEVADAQRLRRVFVLSGEKRWMVNRIMWAMEVLDNRYTVRARFGRRSALINWYRLPHDMRYTAPTITIYERRL
ncbi:MAG: ArnT family glycosyltransferase [Armatimonadota bacterium]